MTRGDSDRRQALYLHHLPLQGQLRTSGCRSFEPLIGRLPSCLLVWLPLATVASHVGPPRGVLAGGPSVVSVVSFVVIVVIVVGCAPRSTSGSPSPRLPYMPPFPHTIAQQQVNAGSGGSDWTEADARLIRPQSARPCRLPIRRRLGMWLRWTGAGGRLVRAKIAKHTEGQSPLKGQPI